MCLCMARTECILRVISQHINHCWPYWPGTLGLSMCDRKVLFTNIPNTCQANSEVAQTHLSSCSNSALALHLLCIEFNARKSHGKINSCLSLSDTLCYRENLLFILRLELYFTFPPCAPLTTVDGW